MRTGGRKAGGEVGSGIHTVKRMEKNQGKMEEGHQGINSPPAAHMVCRRRDPSQHLPLCVPTVPTRGLTSFCPGFFLFDLGSISHLALGWTLLKPGSHHVSLLLQLCQQLPKASPSALQAELLILPLVGSSLPYAPGLHAFADA